MKVLIADDDQLIRTMLAEMLVELGHTVVAAANGTEAVALARSEEPDVLILDFLMPRLSGLDALRQIRLAGPRLPAVLLTALSDGSVRAVSGGDAPDAILEKPFHRRGVEKALAQALRSR